MDLSNTDKLAGHMQECARLGIPVLPPDINRSGAEFRVETTPEGKEAIRFALAAVKRVGEAAMRDLVAARDAAGPFASLADLAGRVDPKLLNKMQIENLARAGAFEPLEKNRARVMAGAETILRRARNETSPCGCPTSRTGRCWTAWRMRRRRSASTSRRIRSTPIGRPCSGWG